MEDKELTQDQKDESKERLEFIIPISQEIIKILAKYPEIISDVAKDKRQEEYRDLVAEIMDLFVEKDINFTDRHFVFQLAMLSVESAQHQTLLALDRAYNMALNKLFGKDMLDVKLSDIDNTLKE